MGVTIYLSVWAGKWLDTQFPNEKGWFRIGCTLLGVFLALYNVIHTVNKMNK
ncbi:MAG: AtpZ/AtpI family protein [Leptolyngbya sp. SIO3F4]|nr:AtpZ/AtpI family protein [Leptolyngbya sp. SIO3F4]